MDAKQGQKKPSRLAQAEQANKHPVNRASKAHLIALGLTLQMEQLHLLQLAAWGLGQGLPTDQLPREEFASLLEFLQDRASPEKAAQLVLQEGPGDGDLWMEVQDLMKHQGKPVEAAEYLLEKLENLIVWNQNQPPSA